ncbi:MAG: hypothetical protein M0Z54_11590 [Thermaerobacter sp.]|nr:hypothetical protein [Thermaerobacter sp.]
MVQVSASGSIRTVASLPALGTGMASVELGPAPRSGHWTLSYTVQNGSQSTVWTVTLIHTTSGAWHTVPHARGRG